MTEYRNPTPVQRTPVQAKESDVNSILNGLKGKGKLEGEAVDWVVSHFGSMIGCGDRGLYDYLVVPVAGKFGEMRANGEAWGDAAKMLGLVQANLRQNARTLITSDWTGKAAEAFFGHIDVALVGGLYVGQKCSEWMQKGFVKLAELSEKVARKCVEIINVIVERILKLFAKVIPFAGQIIAIVDWVASGFDDAPYISDVQEIVGLVQSVLALHKTITELVSAMQGYYDGFRQAVEAVAAIPEIDSTRKASEIAGEFNEGREKMKKSRADIDKKAAETQQRLDDTGAKVDASVG